MKVVSKSVEELQSDLRWSLRELKRPLKNPFWKIANTRKCENLKKYDKIREYLRKSEIM